MPSTCKPLHAVSLVRLKQLKEELALRSISQVVAKLLAELAQDATPPPPLPGPSRRSQPVSQLLDVAVIQQIIILQHAYKLANIGDVVEWLLDLHALRQVPAAAAADEPPRNLEGEKLFASILAFLEQKRKRKRAEKKAARAAQ